MTQALEIFMLMLVLLNPFLLTVYLLDLIRKLTAREFTMVMLRACMIAGSVFALFAWAGAAVFTDVLQVRFAAFLIFGGIVFLIIAVRFIAMGAGAIITFRGEPAHLAGAVAMPFLIGPGTINAAVLAGSKLTMPVALAVIAAALLTTVIGIIVLKQVHDIVNRRNARLVEAYLDLVGRASALVIGTIAVEMIMQGIDAWLGMNAPA